MITISIAQFFLKLVGKKAVQDGEPAGPVLDGPKPASLKTRAVALLPVGIRKGIVLRHEALMKRQALQRLAETSAHLLADIGVVERELATFDGHHPQVRNNALTSLAQQALLPAASAKGYAAA